MHTLKRLLTITAVMSLVFALMSPGAASAQGQQQDRPEAWPELPETLPDLDLAYARGARALEKLGHRLPAVAQTYGIELAELRSMLSSDDTLFVDNGGELVYFDTLAPGETTTASGFSAAEASPAFATSDAPPEVGPQFSLASNPGAAKTIFLDFSGHVTEGTTWNSRNNIESLVSPPFDIDGYPESWSTSELDIIARSWAVVAEDYAPWNINVTTIDPGSEALRRSGASDTQWGVRVVITEDNLLNCGCGGGAYIGSFDDPTDEPAFIFNANFSGISEAITHEVGHTMLLAHDGGPDGDYYRGHNGTGVIGWAPIMGSSYWEPLTQWSQQEFFGATNLGTDANFGYGHDDVSIISSMTNGNNFGLKADDHGDASVSATALAEQQVVIDGLIGTRHDLDVFSFSTTGGPVDITATAAQLGPNLDIALTVKDVGGTVIATDNPALSLNAALSLELDGGDYTIEVDGAGAGAPTSSSPSGYTDYASFGQYSLALDITEVAPAAIMGDVNCDGRASVSDALFVAQYAVGNRTDSATCPLEDPGTQIYAATGDVNGNGRISVADALLISQCSVGLPNDFCPEPYDS